VPTFASRHRADADQSGTIDGDVVTAGVPSPPVEAWSRPLLDSCTAAIGSEVEFADGPDELEPAQGAWAFGGRLRIAERPSASEAEPGRGRWEGSLVLRLATDRSELEREAAAMQVSRSGGCGAPEVLDIVEVSAGDPAGPRWALVSRAVTGVALPDLIGFNLHQADDLLRGFAAHHDAIHRLPVDDLGDVVPVLVAADEVARIDSIEFPAERAWLLEHLPIDGARVLCHGGYQPLCVFGPPADEWEQHGGPGRGLSATNWCGAVQSQPEFDVAFTLVALWSAPCFAKNRSERAAIKMIRNTLVNTYKLGYTAHRDVDPDRLRFWQAFHSLRGLARLAGAYDAAASPFVAQDRGPLPADLATELRRHFRQLTGVR
jgi:hypothetical protein